MAGLATMTEQATARPRPATPLEDFRAITAAYQQAAERLKDSHDLLLAEVARLRAELASKNQQLERRKRLAALGEMAAAVAHEVRNPLGSILLYADLLARQLADQPDRAALAGRICSAVRGLDAIVNDMLTFTRVVEVPRQPTALADLVAEAAAEVRPRLDEAGVTLRADGIDPRLPVELDGRLFKRVLVNLLLNGADAIAGSEQRASGRDAERVLTVSAEPLDAGGPARWRITVADTGPGIAPEAADRLFHPFFTTKTAGTGLGLAIVHHIVDAHGGTITAANRPEGGAVFTILLA